MGYYFVMLYTLAAYIMWGFFPAFFPRRILGVVATMMVSLV